MENLEFYKYVEINIFLSHWLIKEQIKRKIRKHFEINETKTHTRTYGLQLKLWLEGNLKLEKLIIYCEFVYYF